MEKDNQIFSFIKGYLFSWRKKIISLARMQRFDECMQRQEGNNSCLFPSPYESFWPKIHLPETFWLDLAILVYNQHQWAYQVQNTVNNFQVWLLVTTVHTI